MHREENLRLEQFGFKLKLFLEIVCTDPVLQQTAMFELRGKCDSTLRAITGDAAG